MSSNLSRIFIGSTLAALFCACTTFPTIDNMSEVDTSDERVVIADIKIQGTQVSEWVGPSYSISSMTFSKNIDIEDNKLQLTRYTGSITNDFIQSQGGTFKIKGPKKPFYFLGITAFSSAAFIIQQASLYPFPIKIPPKVGDCEYLGTILIKKDGELFQVTIEDQFNQRKGELQQLVKGCILTKNLGQSLASNTEVKNDK